MTTRGHQRIASGDREEVKVPASGADRMKDEECRARQKPWRRNRV